MWAARGWRSSWPARGLVSAACLGLLLSGAGTPAGAEDGWRPLFDGRSLAGWKEVPFPGRGGVRVEDEGVVLEPGRPLTGIAFLGALPSIGYELRFEAARFRGNDFFASVTFPFNDSFCTLVTGGWGGDIVGLSSIDGWDASEYETRTYVTFENNRWYKFRLRVQAARIRAWIDDRAVVDVPAGGREIGLRFGETDLCAPLGFASYATAGGVRKIEIRRLP
jgi:hypothetical protein